jgi:hypothetical protein
LANFFLTNLLAMKPLINAYILTRPWCILKR